MSYYHHQYPPMYSCHPMSYPNQEMYAMYPNQGPPMESGPHWFDGYQHPMNYARPRSHFGHHQTMLGSPPQTHFHHHAKPGYNNRKISADSGISEASSGRKTSNISNISTGSLLEDVVTEEDIKEETPFEEPEEDVCKQIVEQVEFYFSDASITKDKFLLKHVKRNKEGFVSLKLISSFKRVKHLTKDWRQVAFAVEHHSDKLEVNDLKTKVRRLEALPEYDETTPSRTVVAMNLPLERPTIEAVAEIFAKCGDIVLVRILRPGNPIPVDVKPFANKHPEMTAKVCALIEFECTEFAHKAVSDLSDDTDESKMKVMELTAPPAKTTRKDSKKITRTGEPGVQRRFSHAGFTLPPQHINSAEQVMPRRKISLFHNMKFSPIGETHQDVQQQHNFALNPNAPTFQMHGISRPSPMPYMTSHHPMSNLDLAMPYMIRRMSMMHHHHPEVPVAPVVRQPRNPEKGKGFQKWCKNRMETTPTKKPASKAVPIVAPPKEEEGNGEQHVEQEPQGAAAVAVVVEAGNDEVGSDSGNEDGSHSEPDVDLVDDERTR